MIEPPAVIRRRRIVVAIVVVIGTALLGFSMTRQPGDASFFWLTLALAAVWITGALLSGPLHLGSRRRPVLTGTAVGLLVGAAFVVGGLVAREISWARESIARVLEFANYGPLWVVVFLTVINGVAEELFFRGALYTALGALYPGVISTVSYVIATLAAGNPMLGVAAAVLGTVCAFERRITGGVLAPMLTHFLWGLAMVLALPPVFGV
jgi:membrane protease YdiL (CAAX protease family)